MTDNTGINWDEADELEKPRQAGDDTGIDWNGVEELEKPRQTDDDFGEVEPLRWEDGDGGEERLPEGERNQWGGNLRNEGRRVLFRRDKDGKVNGYSTTSSMLVRHDDGKFAVVPTVVGGKELSQEEAVKHYAETGEHWGMADDEESAQKMAQEVHDTHMKGNQAKWNDWLHEHWDEVSDDIRNDRGMAYKHKKRTAPDKITLMERLANDDTDDERKKKEQAHHWQEDYSMPSMSPFGMGLARPKTARKYDDKAQMDDLAEIATEAGLSDWQVKRIRSESKTPEEMREALAYVAGNRPVRDGETPEQQTVGWRSVPKTIVNTAGNALAGFINLVGTVAGGVDEDARHAFMADDPMAKKEGESFDDWLGRVHIDEKVKRMAKRNPAVRENLERYYKWEAPIAGKEGMHQEHSVMVQNGREGTGVGNLAIRDAKRLRNWINEKSPVGNSGNAVVDWLEGAASGITQFAYLGPTMIAMSAADSYQQSRSMSLESGRTGGASEALATGNALFDGTMTAAFYYAPFRRWMNGKGIVPVQPVEKFTFSGLSKAMGRFNAKREFLNQGAAALEAGGIMGIQGAGDTAFRQLASGEDLDLGEITIEGAKSGLDGIAIGAIMGTGRILNARIRGERDYEKVVRAAAQSPEGRLMLARFNPDGMMDLKRFVQEGIDIAKAHEKPAADFEADTLGRTGKGRAPAPDWKPTEETLQKFQELCDKAGLPPDAKLATDILFDPNVANFLGDALNSRFAEAARTRPGRTAIPESPIIDAETGKVVEPSQALAKKIHDEFGQEPAKFTLPQTADGKPSLTPMKWRDNRTGKENTSNIAHDPQTGVTIMEEADGTFSVHNDTGDSDGAKTIAEAVEKAKELALMDQYTELDRRRKRTVIENERAAKYGKKNVVYFNTMAEAAGAAERMIKRTGMFFGTNNVQQFLDPAVQDRDAFITPDGTVAVILDNVHEVGDIPRILAHEFVGHGGPNADFGGKVGARVKFADNIRAKEFEAFKQEIVDGLRKEVRASDMDAVNRDLGEVFAHYAAANFDKEPSKLDKLVSAVNGAARKLKRRKTYSASDVKTMLARWREAVKGTGGDTIDLTDASPRFDFFAPDKPAEAPGERGEVQTGKETPKPTEAPTGDSGASGAVSAEPRRLTSAEEVVATAKTPFNDAEKATLKDAADVSGIDETVEMPKNAAPLSFLSSEAPIVRLNPAKIYRSDAILPNMKKDANRKSGITKPLEGEWHPTMGGVGAVWLTKDGKLTVITGRHRSELAERKGKSMLYYLFREADGFTKENAMIYDAVANIHDEKGTINDYLGFLDKTKPTRDEAEKAGILYGKGLVAWSLYRDATDAVRNATATDGNPGEGQISPQQATVIAEAAPRDADKRNPSIQRQLLKTALGGMRGKAFDMYARIRADELSKTPVNENLLVGEQMDLFSSPEDQAADILAQRQSQYRTKKAQGYQTVAQNLRAALNKEGKLELTDEYAKDLGVTDKSDKKQLEGAYEKAVERANYWENTVRLDDADKAAMDAEINAAADAKAKKLAELKAKREAAKSGKPKVVVSKNATTTPADETKPPAGETKPAAGETKKADSETKKPVLETQKPDSGTKKPVLKTKTAKKEMSKSASKTPSIKMKDEAAEKLAQKQEDELAALFDTPEFGIMRGDEGKRNKLELDEDRLGGSLGIPDDAVPNRQLIEKVRGVLAVQGETSARAMWSGRISPDTAKALFDALNSDKEAADLFKRVFPVAQSLGIEYSFAQYSGQNSSVEGLTLAQYERGGIKLFANTLQFTSPQTFASTILHETIHGVTVYAMEVYDGSIKNPKTKLTPELAAAAKDIFDIYKANKPWIEKDYGFTDAYEMIAELANPKFRERLKKKNIWQKIWDAIKRIFGFNTSNTHDAVAGALDRFVESYDKDVFDSYIKDSYRNTLDGDLLGANARFSMQKAEKGMEAASKFLAWAKKWKLDPSKKKYQREWADRNGVSFDTPDFNVDVFQKRVGAVANLVKTYKESGVADFKTLATRMAERFPEKFATMKPYLRGVWNAVADQMNLSDVSRSQADEIFGIIDAQTKEAENERELRSGGSSRVDSDEGTGGGRNNGLRPDAGVSAAGGGDRNSGGMLAGGRVRSENPDRRVDGEQSGAVSGQPEGRTDQGNAEVLQGRGNAGSETSSGNGSVGDSVRSRGSELQAGDDRAGDGDNPKLRVKKAAKKAADSTKPNPSRRDFVMTKAVEEAILEKKTANRVRNNLDAIKLIRELKARDYAATPEEQAALAKFVGWGGLREAVFGYDLERAYDLERSGEPDRAATLLRREGISQSAYELHKELRQVLNDKEYESAKESASTAFYTPVEFVRVLHEALRRLGVKGGRFLGPSAGTGNFASAAGAYEKPVNWQFVEKDAMTGEMLKALFPNQRVNIGGFEDTKFPDGFFDFAIDNVPYADVPINDRSLSSRMFKIHDYFFAKTLAKLRPGGVMAFLTSTGTLDKTSPILRQFLTEHGGRIVGAVRLPNGFFSENAGTDVASDLVIVQKVQGKPDNSAFEKGVEYGSTTEWVRRKGQVKKPLTYNGYFKDHPEQIVGEMTVGSGQFGPTLQYKMPPEIVPPGGKGLWEQMNDAVSRAFAGVDKDLLLKEAAVAQQQDHTPIYDDEGLRQGNVTMKDGKPFIKSGEMLEPIEFPKDRGMKKELAKRMRTPKQIMDGLMDLRKAMRDVIDAQMADSDVMETDLAPLQAKLNETYNAFMKKNGSLHDKWISPFVMLDKADGNRLLALERIVKDESGKSKIVKSDIFTKRVISRGQRATRAETPKDALVICYSEMGGINIPRIATLLDTTAEEAIDRLKEGGDVFENPQTGLLEPSWGYLSGRVRAKLAAARAAVEAGEESFRANVEALEKVQPPMVRLEDAEIKFGATWVDPECMADFLRDAFGSEHMRISLSKNEVTGQWNVEFGHIMNEDPWGETSWDPKKFVSRVLNHESMNHYVTDPIDKKRYLDERRTEANKLAAEKLHSAFSQFIQSSEKWATPMYERYNAVMTDMVEIQLPNNILPFRSAGMSEDALGKLFEGGDPKTPKKGREYQSAVIARGVLGNGSLCLAHCVGAGKTLEMQSIGVLGRHLGLFKKPMYVVPNHMLEQFMNEFVEAFPNANILKMSEDDVKPENRRAFFAQVANGDWDAIVVKHSTFSMKLPISDKYQKEFLEARIKDLDETIAAMREAGEKISVDQATKKKQKLQAKLEKLMNAENHDSQIVPFEELGVDQLFVDEAHNFKGMEITTRQGRTGGLNQGTSERATDMQMKTQYIQSLYGGERGVVFATGTPLSNAPVVEAFVMLKYLAPNKLEEQGLKHFDDFVDAFGRITTESEFDVGGKNVKEKDKVSAFVNIPEMMKLFKSVVDIVNPDQLDIPRPKPKYHMIDVEMSPLQEKIMEMVAREASTPPSRKDRGKYLALTRIAKNACISPRLLGFEDGGNKIIRAVAEIKRVYDETADNRGAQLVFTDIFNESSKTREAIDAYLESGEEGGVDPELAALFGGRGGNGKFNLNEEIRDLLVQAGIPKDEIAIIQDIDKSKGDKDANKAELFAKVRSGEVRVLIGSRPKMGEGTNVQERLAAIHLLHPGWKPAEDEQAIGRIIRYGNEYKEGQIFYYLTKGNANIGSYETKNHQLIGVKSKLIDQVMHGNETVRTVEMDESAIDRDMLMGLASGNKALMELIDVKKRVHKLELNTESTLTSARRNKDKAEANSRILERRREEFAKEQEGVKEWREKNEGKSFTLSTSDGRSIEKVKEMADYVAAQVVKQLTKDRYDRDDKTVLGDFNGVELVLAYDKWGDEKFRLAVPLLGVAREINYSGFIPDFSQGAMTAFKGKIFETVSPDFAKAYENSLADMDRQAKKMSADADKLQKDYEQMRDELIQLRTRQAELERAVTPLVVQAVEDRSIAAYGNWAITKDKIDLGMGLGYTATRDKDGKTLNAPTVKELIPLMDAEDFANPKMAASKTIDIRQRPDAKGETPRVDSLATGDVDFDTPELSPDQTEWMERESHEPDAEDERKVFGFTNADIEFARKVAEMKPIGHTVKPHELQFQRAQGLLSNRAYMEKLAQAVAKLPRATSPHEDLALGLFHETVRREANEAREKVKSLQGVFDELNAMPKDERDTEWSEEQQKTLEALRNAKTELASVQRLMDAIGVAHKEGGSDAARTLNLRRALANEDDLSYAGIRGSVASKMKVKNGITPEFEKRIGELADEFNGLDEKQKEVFISVLKADAEKELAKIKNGEKMRRAVQRMPGDEAKRVVQRYNDALSQLEVAANETGGMFVGLADEKQPGWGKFLRAIAEYHCFENPDIKVDEVVQKMIDTLRGCGFENVDEVSVWDEWTGYGHSYRQSRFESQRRANWLRSQALHKRQIHHMDETNTLPLSTGMERDVDPTPEGRALTKEVYERKKEVPDEGRAERHLKGLLDSAKTRVRNSIADLERAIATGERIPGRERTVTEDIELRELRRRKDELRKLYDETFGTERTLTDAQRLALAEKAAAKQLEYALADLERARSGDFSKRPKRPGVESPTLDVLRERTRQAREERLALKRAAFEFGMTPEETEAYNARRLKRKEDSVMKLAERIATGDIRTNVKPKPPLPPELQKHFDELDEQQKNARRKLRQLREDARRAAWWPAAKSVADYWQYLTGMFVAHKASADRSAVLRQALMLTAAHPVLAAKDMAIAEKAAWSKRKFDEVNADILADPIIRDAMENHGLKLRSSDITNVHDVEMFSGVDRIPPEMIQRLNKLFDMIPGVGKIYGGIRKVDRAILENSERHYVTFLNLMSSQTYKMLLDAIPDASDYQKRRIAYLVNMYSGHGAMSEKTRNNVNSINNTLGHAIWSPSLAAAQIQQALLLDVFGAPGISRDGGKDGSFATGKEAAQVTKEAVKMRIRAELAILALGSLLALLWSDDDWKSEWLAKWRNVWNASGADKVLAFFNAVEATKHPVLGKTHVDLEMGKRTFNRILGLALTGEYETSTGRRVTTSSFGGKDLADMVGRYFYGKLSPHYSAMFSIANRKTFTGEPVSFGNMLADLLPIPLSAKDVVQSAIEDKWYNVQAPVAIVATLLGAGGNVYDEKYYERAVNRYKEYKKVEDDPLMDEEGKKAYLESMRTSYPFLKDDVRYDIEGLLKDIERYKRQMANQRKQGATDEELRDYVSDIEAAKAEVLKLIRANR